MDHRPPLIAFVFLLVLAIAVVGTSARAGEGVVLSGGPLELHTSVSGTAAPALSDAAPRVVPVSRSQPRSETEVRLQAAATQAARHRTPKAGRVVVHEVDAALGRHHPRGERLKHLGKELRRELRHRLRLLVHPNPTGR